MRKAKKAPLTILRRSEIIQLCKLLKEKDRFTWEEDFPPILYRLYNVNRPTTFIVLTPNVEDDAKYRFDLYWEWFEDGHLLFVANSDDLEQLREAAVTRIMQADNARQLEQQPSDPTKLSKYRSIDAD